MLVEAGSFDVALTDFGLAELLPPGTAPPGARVCLKPCGTNSYKAPEVWALSGAISAARAAAQAGTPPPVDYRDFAYDPEKYDVWAAVLTVFALVGGHPAVGRAQPGDWFFDVISNASRCHATLPAGPCWTKFWQAHEQWGAYSKDFKSFVQAGLAVDPASRASVAQLLEHPWVAGAPSRSVLRAELARRAAHAKGAVVPEAAGSSDDAALGTGEAAAAASDGDL